MIKGKTVTLRTAKYEEIELIYKMGLSTEYMNQCFEEDFKDGLESFIKEYRPQYFDNKEPAIQGGLMICLEENPVGFISYGQISDFFGRPWIYHFGVMELDIWLDGEENCNKGLGVDAIRTLSDYLNKKYNIRTFIMCPERINPRAIHAYEKCGFKEVEPSVKNKILIDIFTERGLELLKPDDEYLSDEYCFMIKKYM